MRADAYSIERRNNFEAGTAAAIRWSRAHPLPLEGFLDFLQSLQAVFGPFPVDHEPWPGSDYRL